MNKKSCIIADNHKIDAFKKALTKDGFEDFEVKEKSIVEKTSMIFVNHSSKRTYDLKNLCEKAQKQFKNNKT